MKSTVKIVTLRRTDSIVLRLSLWISKLLPLLLAGLTVGCGGDGTAGQSSAASTSQSAPRTYMAGAVAGGYGAGPTAITQSLATYTIDDEAQTFSQSSYVFSTQQNGPQLNYSGVSATLPRGLLSLGLTYYYGDYGNFICNGVGSCATTYSSPVTGGWAFELAGQAGGLVNLQGLPFSPLVDAQDCPNFTIPASFQFITIPAALSGSGTTWNSQYDTAYGRVTVSTSGSSVDFSNIQQFTISGSQLTGYQDLGISSAYSSMAGACSPTFYGNTISAPGEVTITDPGVGQTIAPAAIVGVGPSGLLVESNGNGYGSATGSSTSGYQPFLGAGTGAMGLPQPSSPIDVSSLTGAQYLGIFYGGGTSPNNWSSSVASFGFPNLPSTCQSVTAQTSNMIYGGDYPGNNPASAAVQANGGYGNCDFVIDLGTQDPSNNGFFPAATVWVGSSFSGNVTQKNYSFPATAIAGQLNGKFAIFLIGLDTFGSPHQAWGIYLLQSN